ncbi:MAG: SMC-Scp complex subunit ScpB [Elusimicrobiota bacterium]|nr:SMC-Scp complex subunit ScpB [Elusimicrobiota bacterium]
MDELEIKKVVETLLFISDQPLPVERISQIVNLKENKIQRAIEALEEEYKERTFQIMNVAGGYQMATRQEYSLWIRRLYHNRMTVRLSVAALETLSIIAYEQPITRTEVEKIRGVEVIGPLETLLERRLITTVGRKESVGRPLLYGTTKEFLRQFGLHSLDNLPDINTLIDKESPADAEQAITDMSDAADQTKEETSNDIAANPDTEENVAEGKKEAPSSDNFDEKIDDAIAGIQEKEADDLNNEDNSALSEEVADENSSVEGEKTVEDESSAAEKEAVDEKPVSEEEVMADKLADIIEDGDDSSATEEQPADDKNEEGR